MMAGSDQPVRAEFATGTPADSRTSRIVSTLLPYSPSGAIRWTQVLVLYAVAHGFMLASWNALYWDDWIVYANGPAGLADFISECQRCVVPAWEEIGGFLIAPGPWLMRALTFVIFPFVAFFFLQFLQRTGWTSTFESTTLTLFVLFLPLYGSRIAAANFVYSFSLLLFVFGASLTMSNSTTVRTLSPLPIFLSMVTASLQFFVIVLIAILVAKVRLQQFDLKFKRSTSVVVAVLGLSALFHRFLASRLLPSTKVTDGYNTIQPAFAARAGLIGVVLLLPILTILRRRRLGVRVARESYLFGIGLAILSAGTFPYLAVGHFANFSDWVLPILPDESDWNSRHQLLQPFGFALILLAVVHMFGARRIAAVTVVLASSISLNVATTSGYYLDALKQEEFMLAVAKASDQLMETTALVITDDALRYNARGRIIRDGEWVAMIKRATGTEISFIENFQQFCRQPKPVKHLAVTATNGRLKALIVRRAGISIKFTKLGRCQITALP